MNVKNLTNNGTINEIRDSVVAISPQEQQIQQNVVHPSQEGTPNQESPKATINNKAKKEPTISSTQIFLNPKKPHKINFFRVIKALCLEGFFVDQSGCKADEKDVFAAFGQALGEDFSDYGQNLTESRKHNSIPSHTNIFTSLSDSFADYERQLKDNKESRNQ